MRNKFWLGIITVGIMGVLLLLFQCTKAQSGPKVLLIYDLEGITATDSPEDCSMRAASYPATQESLTQDVNAAIRGLLKAGTREVVLTDGHGSGNPEPDYLLDRLPEGARFDIREEPYDPYIDTLDDTFDAVVCIGMHSRAGGKGFLSHTYDRHTKWIMAGYDMNETMLVSASAARFNLPMILVTGDNVLKKEVEAFSPHTRYVVVKKAISRTKAESRIQAEVDAEIEAAAEDAIKNIKNIPRWDPPELKGTFNNRYSYNQPMYAAFAMDFPGAQEVDNKTVSIETDTFMEAYLTFRLLCNYTAFSRVAKVYDLLRQVEGSTEIFRKIRDKWPSQGERNFVPTGKAIDRSFLLIDRGKHGYR